MRLFTGRVRPLIDRLLPSIVPLTFLVALLSSAFFQSFADGMYAIAIPLIGAGILALYTAMMLIARPLIIDRRVLRICAVLIAIIALIFASALSKGISIAEFSGTGFEPGTIVSFIVCCIAVLSGAVSARLRGILTGVLVLCVAALSVVIGSFVASIFGHIFLAEGVHLWQSTGIMVGIAVISAVSLFLSGSGRERVLGGVGIAVSVPAVLLTGSVALALSTAAAVFALVLALFAVPTGSGAPRVRYTAFVVGVTLLIAAALLVSSALPERLLWQTRGELKPSATITTHMMFAAFSAEPHILFLGKGPNSFKYTWDQYRPTSINASPLWNTEVPHGYGLVQTLAAEFGIPLVFLLALLIPMGAAAWYARSREEEVASNALLSSVTYFVLSLFIAFWSITTIPDLVVLMLATYCIGVYAVLIAPPGQDVVAMRSLIAKALAAILIGTALLCMYLGAVRFFSHREYILALHAASDGTNEAREHLIKSTRFERTPRASYLLAKLYNETDQTLVAAVRAGTASEEDKQALLENVPRAVEAAQRATDLETDNYRAWTEVATAQIIQALVFGDGSEVAAIATLKFANANAQNHPLAYFLLAQAHLIAGQDVAARMALENALKLKPNYTEALELYRQFFR